jgi:hypothetical protein
MTRENYYLLLDLEPSVKDISRIGEAIAKKQAEWSRDRNHPTKARQAQKNLDLLQDIRAVMSHPIRRDEEAHEAQRLRNECQKEAARQLDDTIKVLAAQGFLLETQVTDLTTTHKGSFTPAEVRARIKVPIRAAKPNATSQSKPVLDKVLAAEINTRLRLLGRRDLYEFLGRERTSSLAALQERTRWKDADMQKFNDKTAKVTAEQELVGHCLNLFAEEGKRRKYDNTLEMQAFSELDSFIEAAGKLGEIPAAVMEQLLRTARERGLAVEEARKYIVDFAHGRKWIVTVPQVIGAAGLPRCGACGILNEAKANACVGCGERLSVVCPRCQTLNSSDNRACSSCGFSVGDSFLVRRLLRDADLALVRGDLRQAETLSREAQLYWPDSADVRACLAKVRKHAQEESEALVRVQAAMTARRYVEALGLLGTFRQLAPHHSEIAQLARQINSAIEGASKHVARGRALEQTHRTDDAIDAYMAALGECLDLGEARDAMAKCPPQAPLNLLAAATSRSITLRWEASISRGAMKYRVVRKPGSEPRAPSDGDLVRETGATTFTDPEALPGLVYFYAVYCERGGTLSGRAAIAGPIIHAADVEKLRAIAGDRRITLDWSAPSLARGVEVWRKPGGEPLRRGDGTRLPAVTHTSSADTKLANGKLYGYRVIAVFDGADGHPVYSDGATITATPAELPKPVTDLSVVRRGRDYQASWAPPAIGQVQLFAAEQRPAWECGDLVSATDLDRLGHRVPILSPHSAHGQVAMGQVLYLVPVTLVGSAAVVGQVVPLSWIDDVEDLLVTASGDTLVARWAWPAQIETAVVLYRGDRFPMGPEDSRAVRARCSRFKYDREGGFRIRKPKAERIYLAVYAMTKHGAEERYASGASPGSRAQLAPEGFRTLRYAVASKSRFFGSTNEFLLTITPNAATTLPELILVAKAGGMPLDPKNGTTVLRIPQGSKCAPDQALRLTFQANGLPDRWKARLFPVHNADCTWLDFIAEV